MVTDATGTVGVEVTGRHINKGNKANVFRLTADEENPFWTVPLELAPKPILADFWNIVEISQDL